MGDVLTEKTNVADFVTNNPSTTSVFTKHKIDFCCGGGVPLKSACEALHLDPTVVLKELDEATKNTQPATAARRDWVGEKNVDTIVAYILNEYHDPLREDLDAMEAMLHKVARVHGERHPELKLMVPIFEGLSEELKTHLLLEEENLFPHMKDMYVAWRDKGDAPKLVSGSVQNIIQQIEAEHEGAGEKLVSLRTLSKDFEVPSNGCDSYRALYRGLEKIEDDLHHHIHLENYVLHPLVIRMEQELSRGE